MSRTLGVHRLVVPLALAAACSTPEAGEEVWVDLASTEQEVTGVSCVGDDACSGAGAVYSTIYRVGGSSTSLGALLQTFVATDSGTPSRVYLAARDLRLFTSDTPPKLRVEIYGPVDPQAPELVEAELRLSGAIDIANLSRGGPTPVPLSGSGGLVSGSAYALLVTADAVTGTSGDTTLVGIGALTTENAYGSGVALRRTSRRLPGGSWAESRFRPAGALDLAFAFAGGIGSPCAQTAECAASLECLAGACAVPQPDATVSPATLTFASTVVGSTSAAQNVTISNEGNVATSIGAVSTSGPFASTSSCGTSLNPGASCTVAVTFSPVAGGAASGSLSIVTAAGTKAVPLSGTGVDYCSPNPCLNGGTCTNGASSFVCSCPSGGGTRCEYRNVSFATPTDLSSVNTAGRSCANGGEMVRYAVSSLTSTTATLSATPASGCLEQGDLVLLVNQQASTSSSATVGNYELLTVSQVSGAVVTFTSAKTRFYGDGSTDSNLSGTNANRVTLQRVPVFHDVSFSSTLTAAAWNGTSGGIFAMQVNNTLSGSGTVDMSGKGYTGGPANTITYSTGMQGGSYLKPPTTARGANGGGGGGGLGDSQCTSYGVSGGGGGYGTPGGSSTDTGCGGVGGGTYGTTNLSTIFLGSAGGTGGTDNVLTDNPPGGAGGAGGGIIIIRAKSITGGTYRADGAIGQGDGSPGCTGGSTVDCWDYSGPGGGGSGGSVLFAITNPVGGGVAASVAGARGGYGYTSHGGAGGTGRSATTTFP